MNMKVVADRPKALLPALTHYCPGCGHGIVHRVIAELIDEMDLRERTIMVAPVGCAVLAYNYLDVDTCEAAHGRTPEVAVGIKRVHPDRLVFTYQGDGDLAAIGTNEIIHVANRGENISVVFINNAVYGMTGGQMAPTTMIGQKTTTTPFGRDPMNEGPPIRVCELLQGFERVVYLERTSVSTPARIRHVKRCIQHSFELQLAKAGFSLVEVLSPCPTYWRKSPAASMKFIEEEMVKTFPLGLVKDVTASKTEG